MRRRTAHAWSLAAAGRDRPKRERLGDTGVNAGGAVTGVATDDYLEGE
jgi:hypothetical protein